MSEEIRMSGLDLEELDAQSAELLPDRVEMATARASARRRSAVVVVSNEAEGGYANARACEGAFAWARGGGDGQAEGLCAEQNVSATATNEANN